MFVVQYNMIVGIGSQSSVQLEYTKQYNADQNIQTKLQSPLVADALASNGELHTQPLRHATRDTR